jgi:hypothetical protein
MPATMRWTCRSWRLLLAVAGGGLGQEEGQGKGRRDSPWGFLQCAVGTRVRAFTLNIRRNFGSDQFSQLLPPLGCQRRSRGRSALPAAWLSSSGCKSDPNGWDPTHDSQAPMPTSLDPRRILGALYDSLLRKAQWLDSTKPAEPGKTSSRRPPARAQVALSALAYSHPDESATQASHPKTHQNLIKLGSFVTLPLLRIFK